MTYPEITKKISTPKYHFEIFQILDDKKILIILKALLSIVYNKFDCFYTLEMFINSIFSYYNNSKIFSCTC